MVTLNTMFNLGVNRACNTSCLVKPIISGMHIQMERLYQAAKELHGITTQAELSRALNQSQQTVNNWETRGISNPGLLKAQAAIGCSATWLATGEGDMVPAPAVATGDVLALVPGAMRVRAVDHDDPELTHIKKVRLKVQAGITGFQVEPEHYEGDTHPVKTSWMRREGLSQEALIAIIVKGESMSPNLREGDTIIVDTRDTKLVSGVVYVVNYEGEAVVKRMVRDGGQWWLTSDNQDQVRYHRQMCKGAECIVIGRVVKKESTYI